jgi:hypothetical protein
LRNGITPFRKFYAGYFRGLPNIAKLRNEIMQMVELNPIIDRLYQYQKEQADLSPAVQV